MTCYLVRMISLRPQLKLKEKPLGCDSDSSVTPICSSHTRRSRENDVFYYESQLASQ